jgi:hypothetical protein
MNAWRTGGWKGNLATPNFLLAVRMNIELGKMVSYLRNVICVEFKVQVLECYQRISTVECIWSDFFVQARWGRGCVTEFHMVKQAYTAHR